MKKYKPISITEKQLEDLIRQAPELIEDGLKYLDHQKTTDRGPLDILLLDSGGALIIAELKIIEDDNMLFQAIDYYDYVTKNIEAFGRLYKKSKVDPLQTVRLLLVAPSFSIPLINRIKWINIPISLITFKAIQFEDEKEITPIFTEITLPSTPKIVQNNTIDDRLNYVTDQKTKSRLIKLLDKIKSWDSQNISIDALQYDLSLKISGSVFSYIGPRRKYFIVYTYNEDGDWTGFPIHKDGDIAGIEKLLKSNIEE